MTVLVLTSKHHGFGWFEPWQGLHWLFMVIQSVSNLSFCNIFHPSNDVPHLTCVPEIEGGGKTEQVNQSQFQRVKSSQSVSVSKISQSVSVSKIEYLQRVVNSFGNLTGSLKIIKYNSCDDMIANKKK